MALHEPGQLIRPSVLVTLPAVPLNRTVTTSGPGAAGGATTAGPPASLLLGPATDGATFAAAELEVGAGDDDAEADVPPSPTGRMMSLPGRNAR